MLRRIAVLGLVLASSCSPDGKASLGSQRMALSSLGEACNAGTGCTSGFCVDGLCCDTACAGQCEACDVAGREGSCSPATGVPEGSRAECASDATVCGTAFCDGVQRTACVFPGNNLECTPRTCTDDVVSYAAFCDGAGQCAPPRARPCAPFKCAGDICENDCGSDSDCADGNTCFEALCRSKFIVGRQCTGSNQCASGFCVDGLCCNTACDGQCEACNIPGREGDCSLVIGAPAGARPACGGKDDCQGHCGGFDGNACVFPGSETFCSPASCAEGAATSATACGGYGACTLPTITPCAPYSCIDGACKTFCSADADCASGLTCQYGKCAMPPHPLQIVAPDAGEDLLLALPASGCSQVGGQPCALLAVLALALIRRRRGC
jgi:hypothetical protein